MADVTTAFQGWNASGMGWGGGTWGNGLTANLTGVGAAGTTGAAADSVVSITGTVGTTALASITINTSNNFLVTTVVGTTQLGSVTLLTDQILTVTGLAGTTSLDTVTVPVWAVGNVGTTALGAITFRGDALPTATAAVGTGQLGIISLSTDQLVPVTMGQMNGLTGLVVPTGAASFSLLGLTVFGSVGTTSTVGGSIVTLTGTPGNSVLGNGTIVSLGIVVAPTGVIGNTALGIASSVIAEVAYVTGVSAVGTTSTPQIWLNINTTQGSTWTSIAA